MSRFVAVLCDFSKLVMSFQVSMLVMAPNAASEPPAIIVPGYGVDAPVVEAAVEAAAAPASAATAAAAPAPPMARPPAGKRASPAPDAAGGAGGDIGGSAADAKGAAVRENMLLPTELGVLFEVAAGGAVASGADAAWEGRHVLLFRARQGRWHCAV